MLQRRHNHETFQTYRVAQEKRPALPERLGVDELPTLLEVDAKKVRGRLELPRGCHHIEDSRPGSTENRRASPPPESEVLTGVPIPGVSRFSAAPPATFERTGAVGLGDGTAHR